MKKLIILSILLVLFSFVYNNYTDLPFYKKELKNVSELRDGDIIFHTSKSNQSQMLQVATNSELTHVGVIFFRNGLPYVFEAVQPVKITRLENFIARGVDGKYKIVRYKDGLTKEQINLGITYSKRQLGKNYDIKFQWSDKKMYCSELVWKIYKEMGIDLCDPKTFSNYNISSPEVQKAIKQRYGSTFNMDEQVVAPVDIYESSLVQTVFNTL
jgi:uncharacterized protein YycO